MDGSRRPGNSSWDSTRAGSEPNFLLARRSAGLEQPRATNKKAVPLRQTSSAPSASRASTPRLAGCLTRPTELVALTERRAGHFPLEAEMQPSPALAVEEIVEFLPRNGPAAKLLVYHWLGPSSPSSPHLSLLEHSELPLAIDPAARLQASRRFAVPDP